MSHRPGESQRGEGSAALPAPVEPQVIDAQTLRLHELSDRIAGVDLPVLIVGETGVGKEHLAERIHLRSGRAGYPLVRINCAAMAPTLFESELFGHERGAFTGANRTKRGWFELADRGTVFLDEIGELPLGLQAKLLRAIEGGSVPRVGATVFRPIAARFIAASNRELEREVDEGSFRRDLYHRIAGVRLHIRPLRSRPTEILPLAETFLHAVSADLGRQAPALSPEAQQALTAYPWPGNIRELRNVIERAVLLAGGHAIRAEHLQLAKTAHSVELAPLLRMTDEATKRPSLGDQIDRSSRTAILRALALCGGNQTLAAAHLGIGRRTLCRWLDRLDIPRPRKRADRSLAGR